MDDVLLFYGKSPTEFITNVRTVFERFRKYKITLNPDKCILGVSQIAFLGHTISSEGISFTHEKIQRFLQLHQPTTVHDLRSFLGMANYFRDHIAYHSDIVRPLFTLTTGLPSNAHITWTEEARHAYHQIKEAVEDLPTLFSPDDHSPIHLYTDASDYGVDAYLCQINDNQERPIRILSKSLSGVERRWNTHEKEAYAIFYGFFEFSYLIRDTMFELFTDHANLVFINTQGSDKVNVRFLQEQNCSSILITPTPRSNPWPNLLSNSYPAPYCVLMRF
jgi:hypothetical protein